MLTHFCLNAISHLAWNQARGSPSSLLMQHFTDLQVNYHSFTQLRLVLMDYPELHQVSHASLFSTLFTSNILSLHEKIQAAFLTAPALFVSNI